MTVETLVLRNCTTLEEFRACVALQKEVWGFSDAELVPLRIFSLAPKIGGQVVGAWDGETLVGYAMAIPGSRNGHPYLHSHMVAVKEGYRNTGLGRKIKLFQREDAIARGYELMEWTFDPLEIKNSYFNLERLGAIARRYNVNQYGITNSPLQGSSAHRSPGCRMVDERRAGCRPCCQPVIVPPVWWKSASKCRAKFMHGRPILRCARRRQTAGAQPRTLAIGIFARAVVSRLRARCRRAMAAFNSAAGTRTGRMLQIRSPRRDT